MADDLGTVLAVPVDHDPWAVPKPGQTVPATPDQYAMSREAAQGAVSTLRPYWMDLDPTDQEIAQRQSAMQTGQTQPGKVLPTTGMNPVPFAALDIGSMLPVGGAAKLAAGVLGAGAKGALKAAAETGAEAAERAGIRAYHGSPHDFTQFDLSKIGTGEGAQAYGHGLYMAENEAVAKQYRDALSGKRKLVGDEPLNPTSVPHAVAELVHEHGGDIAAARNTLMKEVPTNDQERQMLTEALNLLNRGNIPKITPAPIKGHMYEVNIGAHPEHFLDWDKPLSQQSEYVRSLFQQPAPSQGLAHAGAGNAEVLGGFGQGPSAVDQANRYAGIPSGGVVSQRMGSVVDNSKIGNPVIGLNPVDMVNILRGQQGTAKVSGHDASMLLSELPVHGGNNVPLGVGETSSPKGSIASGAAEGFGVSGDIMGRSVKGLPAFTADDLRHMTVPQLLERLGSRDAATNALRDQGVAGIKYLDQGSRVGPITGQKISQIEGALKQARDDLAGGFGDPERMARKIANYEHELSLHKPTSNYVVFDPKLIEIMRKYGIIGAAGVPAYGAMQQQYPLPFQPEAQ